MFENKGEPVGVTMPHPHGQIYGYSVVPKRISEELSNSKKYFEKTGKCLICDLLENEMKETLINWPVETNKDDKTVIFVHREEA